MVDLPLAIIKVARPVHWVKNLAIFAALVFSGYLFDKAIFLRVFEAFWVFNLAASATYIFNDILDVEHDRLHPIKKNRPIAGGSIPIPLGLGIALTLALSAIFLASQISYAFFLLVTLYLLLQIAYSMFLKNLPIIDILIIATGFVIRVYAGAFVIDAHLSVWFLLCVISVALFLASGKRRAELGVVGTAGRKSLERYPRELLNSYVTMFGSSSWMSWTLYSFFESPRASTPIWLLLAEFSRATTINKLLMVTIPLSIFAIMRYEKLIFEERAEAPEKLLLTDLPLVISVSLWVAVVVFILYTGISTTGF